MKVVGSTDSPGRRGSAPDRSRCGGGAWPCLCFDPPGQTEADENWTEGKGQSDAEDTPVTPMGQEAWPQVWGQQDPPGVFRRPVSQPTSSRTE